MIATSISTAGFNRTSQATQPSERCRRDSEQFRGRRVSECQKVLVIEESDIESRLAEFNSSSPFNSRL